MSGSITSKKPRVRSSGGTDRILSSRRSLTIETIEVDTTTAAAITATTTSAPAPATTDVQSGDGFVILQVEFHEGRNESCNRQSPQRRISPGHSHEVRTKASSRSFRNESSSLLLKRLETPPPPPPILPPTPRISFHLHRVIFKTRDDLRQVSVDVG